MATTDISQTPPDTKKKRRGTVPSKTAKRKVTMMDGNQAVLTVGQCVADAHKASGPTTRTPRRPIEARLDRRTCDEDQCARARPGL